ncbi:hypothetical protein [Mucilaginibacter psychrotolerans]|uniref:Uncharacterized protein n=1 Tax=Mucilaginibacter psychrotolerans TaxID=1524096 RepID=A0A4Y8SDB7_9SPHI|nr:hypothetical protein [Mucilaginibacter psychrotolerans]TFF36590.1 hypothetical protein E2R66_15665 [Mucilaginibacter psychrotolerans]
MKKLLLMLLLLGNLNLFAQTNQNWAGTMIVTFKLPPTLSGNKFIRANVIYDKQLLVSKPRFIGGIKRYIQTSFSYSATASDKVGGLKIPVTVPAGTYAWLCDDDMLIEMTVHPERYKIQLTAKGLQPDIYAMPVLFDFVTENSLNLAYLQNMDVTQRNLLWLQKTWMLSVPLKEDALQNTPQIIDTTLYFRLQKNDIPAALRTKPYNTMYSDVSKAGQQFVIKKAYLYKGKIFISRGQLKAPAVVHPDACINRFMDLNGVPCAADGCITGSGNGACAGMFLPGSKAKELEVTVVIDP